MTDAAALEDSPLPTEGGQLADLPLDPIPTGPQGVTRRGDRRLDWCSGVVVGG